MEVTLASGPDVSLDAAARRERPFRCQAAYPTVYRGLIGVGAAPDDVAHALQDASEDRTPVASPDGWRFVVANTPIPKPMPIGI